jgi:uncharacterized protein
MFGFSLQKLLLLLLIVGAVWYGFKFVNRLQQARDSEGKSRSRVRGSKPPASEPSAATEVEDMVRCPTCDAFVAARSTSHCGRSDCPY